MKQPPASSDEHPWPCPHCDYDLRASFDLLSWRARCPECGNSCSRRDVSRHLDAKGRVRHIFWVIQRYGLGLATVPICALLALVTKNPLATLFLTITAFLGYVIWCSASVVLPGNRRAIHIAALALQFGLTNLILAFISLFIYLPVFAFLGMFD